MKTVPSLAIAALALSPVVASASFESSTICSGQTTFASDAGPGVSFDLLLEFDGPSYALSAKSAETGGVTLDTGACAAYMTSGCRISFPAEDGKSAAHFDFSLRAQGEDSYLYSEVWGDGYSGQTRVVCKPR